MEQRKNEIIIEVLIDKIEQLKIDNALLSYRVKELKEENEALKKEALGNG